MMKEKPKRLKGTVLFTVVSVMMVMVVFLLGTLALAATASNRAYSNYQKEQTEYTSRAVLDSVVQAIQDDSDIKKAVLGLPVGSGMTITVNAQDGSDPHEVTVTNTGAGHQSYDPNVVNGTKKGAWLDNNEYLLSVTVGKTMAQTTYTAKLAGVIQPAQTTNNPGGAFVSLGDMDGHEIATHGFTTGGSYVGVGGKPTSYTFSDKGDQTIDGPFYLNGDCTIPNEVYMHFTKAEDFMVIMGDLVIGNGKFKVIYDGFQPDAQMKDTSGKWVYEKSPYIYVKGTISRSGSTDFELGDSNYPLQVYAGSIDSSGGEISIHGDLYTFNEDLTNYWGSSGHESKLFKWTESNIKRSDENNVVTGSWFSKGAIQIKDKGGIFHGDIRCENDITISGNTTVDGDIVCSGTLTVSGATLQCDGTIYAKNLVNEGTIYTSNSAKAVTYSGNEPQKRTVKTELTQKTYTWYENLVSNVQVIETFDYNDDSNVDRARYHATFSCTKHTAKETNGVPDSEDDETEVVSKEQDFDINDKVLPDDEVLSRSNDYVEYATYNSRANAKVETAYVYDYAPVPHTPITNVRDAYGKDIYPENYTKDYLEQNTIQQPLDSAYEYPDSPEELGTGTTIYDKDKGEYTIPTYHKDDLPQISVGVMGGTGGSYRLVTKNCVLTGDFNENVYIKADLPITVVLKDVKFEGNNGSGIIINDEKQVTLFVHDKVDLGGGGKGTAIITECLMNAIRGGSVSSGAWKYSDSLRGVMGKMKNDITIYQQSLMTDAVHFPNVIIYGNENSLLLVPNGGLVTAQIRANKMVYNADQATAANKKITYVTPDTYPDGMEYGGGSAVSGRIDVGLIGQLIAGDIYLQDNGTWGMFYTTEGQNTCSCCEHCTNDPECKCTCTICKCKSGSLTPGGTPTDYKVVSYEYY